MRFFVSLVLLIAVSFSVKSQNFDNLKVNEILTTNTLSKATWIEFYNYSEKTININDYYFTNDPKNITKFSISDSFIIKPKSFFLLFSQDSLAKGNFYLNFSLNESMLTGDIAYFGIYKKSDSSLVDSVTYSPNQQKDGISIGLLNDKWVTLNTPSPFDDNQQKTASESTIKKSYTKIIIIIGVLIFAFILLKISRKSKKQNNSDMEVQKNVNTTHSITTTQTQDDIDMETLAVFMAMHVHLNNDNHEVEKTGFWLANNPTHSPWANKSYNFKKTPTIK